MMPTSRTWAGHCRQMTRGAPVTSIVGRSVAKRLSESRAAGLDADGHAELSHFVGAGGLQASPVRRRLMGGPGRALGLAGGPGPVV